jgi:hypothetical protein
MGDWDDDEVAYTSKKSVLKREELSGLCDSDLIRVAHLSDDLTFIANRCLSDLSSEKYQTVSLCWPIKVFKSHASSLKLQAECLKSWVRQERDARSKLEGAIDCYRAWFNEFADGYCQLVKDRVRGAEDDDHLANSRAFRKDKKRAEKKWKLFTKSLAEAASTDKAGPEVWIALRDAQVLCDATGEEGTAV